MQFDPARPADAALVVSAALGDRSALDRLLRAVQQPLFDHIAFLLGDADAAADVLQDVLVTVCRKLIQLHDPSLFRAWVFRIATRTSLRALRRARRAEYVDIVGIAELCAQGAEERTFDPELVTLLEAHVAELPPACRVVVRLRYFEELSVTEVAEALDIPPGTVKSRAAYGVELLRRRLMPAES
jgi:RNA polymerase sigma-70 factor (ECF subfamily)